jgi:hypothetical protein
MDIERRRALTRRALTPPESSLPALAGSPFAIDCLPLRR